jgi:hypothetical protein
VKGVRLTMRERRGARCVVRKLNEGSPAYDAMRASWSVVRVRKPSERSPVPVRTTHHAPRSTTFLSTSMSSSRGHCMPTWRTTRETGRGVRRSGSTGTARTSGSSGARLSPRTSGGNRAARSVSWTGTPRRDSVNTSGSGAERRCSRLTRRLLGRSSGGTSAPMRLGGTRGFARTSMGKPAGR